MKQKIWYYTVFFVIIIVLVSVPVIAGDTTGEKDQIIGKWSVDAGGCDCTVIINKDGSGYTGQFTDNSCGGGTQDLTDISFDGIDVSFIRSGINKGVNFRQEYTGKYYLSSDSLSGTWINYHIGSPSTLKWSGKRISETTGEKDQIIGKWSVDAGGCDCTIIINKDGSGYTGQFADNSCGGGTQDLTDISFDGTDISFIRSGISKGVNFRQEYTGKYDALSDSLSGTWINYHIGSPSTLKWSGKRIS